MGKYHRNPVVDAIMAAEQQDRISGYADDRGEVSISGFPGGEDDIHGTEQRDMIRAVPPPAGSDGRNRTDEYEDVDDAVRGGKPGKVIRGTGDEGRRKDSQSNAASTTQGFTKDNNDVESEKLKFGSKDNQNADDDEYPSQQYRPKDKEKFDDTDQRMSYEERQRANSPKSLKQYNPVPMREPPDYKDNPNISPDDEELEFDKWGVGDTIDALREDDLKAEEFLGRRGYNTSKMSPGSDEWHQAIDDEKKAIDEESLQEDPGVKVQQQRGPEREASINNLMEQSSRNAISKKYARRG